MNKFVLTDSEAELLIHFERHRLRLRLMEEKHRLKNGDFIDDIRLCSP